MLSDTAAVQLFASVMDSEVKRYQSYAQNYRQPRVRLQFFRLSLIQCLKATADRLLTPKIRRVRGC